MSYPIAVDRGLAPLTLIAKEMIQPMNVQPRNTLTTHTDQRLEVCRWNAISVGARYAAMTSPMIINPISASIAETTFHGHEGYGFVMRGAR